jgi:hypothetical protein
MDVSPALIIGAIVIAALVLGAIVESIDAWRLH